ncbi:MAG: hypothetical protein NTZ28_07050, partial [Nitrospirae bacterium]|nr:hypothetical protein [Nitrospirota bacterium]
TDAIASSKETGSNKSIVMSAPNSPSRDEQKTTHQNALHSTSPNVGMGEQPPKMIYSTPQGFSHSLVRGRRVFIE